MDWLSGIEWLIAWLFRIDSLSGMNTALLAAVFLATVFLVAVVAALAVVLLKRVSRR